MKLFHWFSILSLLFFPSFEACGFYCRQIPADCLGLCPTTPFMPDIQPPAALAKASVKNLLAPTGSCIVLGRLYAHPDDTSTLSYAVHGQIGRFTIDDVIISFMPENYALNPGDTIETAWGGSCYSWYNPDSLPTIVDFTATQQVFQINDSSDDTATCFLIPGCRTSFLRYNNGIVKGNITPTIKEMEYEEFKRILHDRIGVTSKHRPSNGMHEAGFSIRHSGRHLLLSTNQRIRSGKTIIRLHSLDGKLLGEYPVDLHPGSSLSIDIEDIPPHGVYIVTINGAALPFSTR